jgi:glycosyltransferase involved in cell wall biosynthesis
MGEIAPIGDPEGLADAILKVLDRREDYARPREEIAARYSSEKTVGLYESLFKQLLTDLAKQ